MLQGTLGAEYCSTGTYFENIQMGIQSREGNIWAISSLKPHYTLGSAFMFGLSTQLVTAASPCVASLFCHHFYVFRNRLQQSDHLVS